MHEDDLTRRRFLKEATWVSVGAAATLGNATNGVIRVEAGPKSQAPLLPNAAALPSGGKPIKLFCCDLNCIAMPKDANPPITPALPQDWAYLNPEEYFAWHRDFGVNIFFLQGYTWCGYAFYPTKLGPVAPGPGPDCFPNFSAWRKRPAFPSRAISALAWISPPVTCATNASYPPAGIIDRRDCWRVRVHGQTCSAHESRSSRALSRRMDKL